MYVLVHFKFVDLLGWPICISIKIESRIQIAIKTTMIHKTA
jgi:hypothetical protein